MKRMRLSFNLSLIDKVSPRVAQVAGAALIALMLLITVEVFIRKFFGITTKVAHDFSAHLLVVLVFLGIAETLRLGKHLRVTVLFDWLNPKTQSVLYKATSIISLAFILLLLYAGTALVITHYRRGVVIGSIVEIPQFIPELFIPIGLFFFTLQLATHLISQFRGKYSKNE